MSTYEGLSSGATSNGTNFETVSQKAPTATTIHKVREEQDDKSEHMRYNPRDEPLTLRRLLMPPEEEEEFKIEPSFLIDNLSFSQINAAQRKHSNDMTDVDVRPFDTHESGTSGLSEMRKQAKMAEFLRKRRHQAGMKKKAHFEEAVAKKLVEESDPESNPDSESLQSSDSDSEVE